MIHELKTWIPYFKEVESGNKPFEIRENDRNFQKHDILHLREYDKDKEKYTGRYLKVKVTYIYHGDGMFGLSKNHCVMGIKIVGWGIVPPLCENCRFAGERVEIGDNKYVHCNHVQMTRGTSSEKQLMLLNQSCEKHEYKREEEFNDNSKPKENV